MENKNNKVFIKRISSVLLSLLIVIASVSIGFSVYADDALLGVDVSEHNGDIDYSYVGEQSNSFVMIRIGYYNHLDKFFWQNVKKAYEQGLDFGFYLYSYAYSVEEAEIEADFVIDVLSQLGKYGERFTLPVAYDIEDNSITKYGKAQITKQMTTFLDKISLAGYVPMIYSNLNWLTNYIDVNTVIEREYKVWFAYFNSTDALPDTSIPKKIGSTGLVADIWQYYAPQYSSPTSFDKNILYNSDELIKPLECVHCYEKNIVKEATCTAEGTINYICNNCGREFNTCIAKTEHTYKNVVTKATLSKNGKIVPTCSKCKATKSATTVYYPKTIKLSATSYTYDGKAKTPSVTVKDSNGKTLVKNTDYTVTYASGRKNVGKYAVKITFKGNYSGTKTLYFTIKPKGTNISSVSAQSKAFTVKWKKQATQTTGYQIQYSTSSKFTNAKTVTVSKNSTTSKKITKLTGKKKYYVRVRTYKTVSGTKYYSGWSGAKNITTKK